MRVLSVSHLRRLMDRVKRKSEDIGGAGGLSDLFPLAFGELGTEPAGKLDF